jgi:hypothetical protein
MKYTADYELNFSFETFFNTVNITEFKGSHFCLYSRTG